MSHNFAQFFVVFTVAIKSHNLHRFEMGRRIGWQKYWLECWSDARQAGQPNRPRLKYLPLLVRRCADQNSTDEMAKEWREMETNETKVQIHLNTISINIISLFFAAHNNLSFVLLMFLFFMFDSLAHCVVVLMSITISRLPLASHWLSLSNKHDARVASCHFTIVLGWYLPDTRRKLAALL